MIKESIMMKNSITAIYTIALSGILYTLYLFYSYQKETNKKEQELSSDYDYKNSD